MSDVTAFRGGHINKGGTNDAPKTDKQKIKPPAQKAKEAKIIIGEDRCCKASHEEICDGALEHYEELSAKCHDWLSTIPQAIKFYKKYGGPIRDEEKLSDGNPIKMVEVTTKDGLKFDLGEVAQKYPEIIRDEIDREIVMDIKNSVHSNDENHMTWNGRNYDDCRKFIGKCGYFYGYVGRGFEKIFGWLIHHKCKE